MDSRPWQDTVTAAATLGAVLVALTLGVVAEIRNARDRRTRRAEDAARRVEAEAAQAQQVSAWLADRLIDRTASEAAIWGKFRRVEAIALNASSEPVWDVEIEVDQVEPGDLAAPDVWSVRIERIGMIPPQERVVRTLRSTPPDAESPAPLVMTFRDSAGARWRRDSHGVLERLEDRPSPSA